MIRLVKVSKNNERGSILIGAPHEFAVVSAEDPEDWVDAFPTRKEALSFVKEKGLTLVGETNEVTPNFWLNNLCTFTT